MFFISFFQFWFSGCWEKDGWTGRQKGQKNPKMRNKTYIHHVPYLRNSIPYGHDFWYTYVLQPLYFSFFQNFGFSGCEVNGKNLTHNYKKFFLSGTISQESYIIRLPFMVHLCKMTMTPRFFSFFHRFDFLGC